MRAPGGEDWAARLGAGRARPAPAAAAFTWLAQCTCAAPGGQLAAGDVEPCSAGAALLRYCPSNICRSPTGSYDSFWSSLTAQKIQFILRQTVYFLRETRSAPSAMRPPPVDGIPRPFAALRGEEVGLGLYGLRVERDTLRLLQQSVESMRSLQSGEHKPDGHKVEGETQTDQTME